MNYRMSLQSSVFVIALGSTVVAPSIVAADCTRIEARGAVLTTHDKLPDDGGILVGWVNSDGDAAARTPKDKDPSDQPDWKATDGAKRPVALTRTTLAPGLSVYKPASGSGAVTLTDKAGKALGAFTHDAKAAANKLGAPTITRVAASVDKEVGWPERHVIATLSQAPPAEAVGLITYRAKDKAPLAVVFLGNTHESVYRIDTFDDAGDCGVVVPGSQPPVAGEKVTYAWVDTFGRLSPQTAPITVK